MCTLNAKEMLDILHCIQETQFSDRILYAQKCVKDKQTSCKNIATSNTYLICVLCTCICIGDIFRKENAVFKELCYNRTSLN